MIDYLYLLDYEADMHTELRIVEGEGAAAADLRIENLDVDTRELVMVLQRAFPQFGVHECLEALIKNDRMSFSAHCTLMEACSLHRTFPLFDVHECFEALIKHDRKIFDTYSTLQQAYYDKKKKDAEALM